jgi:hypothetical protein
MNDRARRDKFKGLLPDFPSDFRGEWYEGKTIVCLCVAIDFSEVCTFFIVVPTELLWADRSY